MIRFRDCALLFLGPSLLFCSSCSSSENAADGSGDGGGTGGAVAGSGGVLEGASGGVTGDGGAGDNTGAGEALCQTGCAATLAAHCSNGPATQAVCEDDCRALRDGACGALYQALQACAQGASVTCDSTGLPEVQACSAEQSAFVACLN